MGGGEVKGGDDRRSGSRSDGGRDDPKIRRFEGRHEASHTSRSGAGRRPAPEVRRIPENTNRAIALPRIVFWVYALPPPRFARPTGGLRNDPLQAVLQQWHVEVQQQPHRQRRRSQIRLHLIAVQWTQSRHSLQLDQNGACDYQIDLLSGD